MRASADTDEARARLRAQIQPLPPPKFGSIVVENYRGLRARIYRDGGALLVADSFRLGEHDESPQFTYAAASAWLSRIGPTLPALTRLNRRASRSKTSELPPGVSESLSTAKKTGIQCIVIMVLFRDGTGRRTKTFRVGRPEWIDNAMYNAVVDVACEFRTAYVAARDRGMVFDPSPWNNWRELLPEGIQEQLAELAKRGRRGGR